MTLTLVTPPTGPLVSLAELKAFLAYTSNAKDSEIQALERSAVAQLDGWSGLLGRAIQRQTWRQDFPGWGGGTLRFAMPDILQDGLQVQYRDAAGALQTITAPTVERDDCGWYLTATGPETSLVRVTFAAEMPEPLLDRVGTAVRLMVAQRFAPPGAFVTGAGGEPDMPIELTGLRWRLVG